MRHADDPIVETTELTGAEAALAALIELQVADLERAAAEDEETITREWVVPRYRYADFDPSLLEALLALERGDDEIFVDEPSIEAEVVTFEDLRVMERLLEPYVDFASLAAAV